MRYATLAARIAERGIKKSAIASAVGITPRTLYNKIQGHGEFTWREVNVIRTRFFPDISLDTLFATTDRTA